MEICRCEDYKRVIDDGPYFTVGTYHHLQERVQREFVTFL